MIISLDMIQSIGFAIVVLLLGRKIRKSVNFLEKYCIPSPVIGGFVFALIAFVLKETGLLIFTFDSTLQNFFMIMFFTSVGFNASLKVLKKGGTKVLLLLIVATGLIFVQNIVPIFLARPLHIDKALALMTGSTALTGGHGTSASISSLVHNAKASSVAIASATYGLIAGSLIGGPIARNLILKYKLLKGKNTTIDETIETEETFFKEEKTLLNGEKFARAFFMLLISMALGSFVNHILYRLGMKSLPYYLGPMIVAAIIRNLTDNLDKKIKTPIEEITILSDISLNLFLSMALMNLKLWELIDLALPIAILLICQTIVTALYVRYITFNVMGRDYDASVIAAGHMGFGMGATPNGITNMKTICDKYEYSKEAFLVVPLVGALFIDFINVTIITGFLAYI